MELEAELYRHPQGRSPSCETYQNRFDTYALGCVLVELVAWRPLAVMFETYTTEDLKTNLTRSKESGEVVNLPSLKDLFESEAYVKLLHYHAGVKVVLAIRTWIFRLGRPSKAKKPRSEIRQLLLKI